MISVTSMCILCYGASLLKDWKLAAFVSFSFKHTICSKIKGRTWLSRNTELAEHYFMLLFFLPLQNGRKSFFLFFKLHFHYREKHFLVKSAGWRYNRTALLSAIGLLCPCKSTPQRASAGLDFNHFCSLTLKKTWSRLGCDRKLKVTESVIPFEDWRVQFLLHYTE